MDSNLIAWLLQGDAWLQYRTRLDLLGQTTDHPDVQTVRQQALADPKIQQLLVDLEGWHGSILNSHRSARQPFHKLCFLADLGLLHQDASITRILEKVMAHPSPEGPFRLRTNISPAHGGSGEDLWAWALCDAPLVLYALLKLGMHEDPLVKKAVQFLVGLVSENGWHCIVSAELGSFHGPGRRQDPCPFATLAMLQLLSCLPDGEYPAASHGIETLLRLWEASRHDHPYMFFMGTDFRKLKAPMFWYDILHVTSVLSHFKKAREDWRWQDMLQVVKSKADAHGRYTPESIWQPWKDWDFGQKKIPSRGLTFFIYQIFARQK